MGCFVVNSPGMSGDFLQWRLSRQLVPGAERSRDGAIGTPSLDNPSANQLGPGRRPCCSPINRVIAAVAGRPRLINGLTLC